MTGKPTYEELEQRIKELENEAFERKRAEESLRESEERYRALFERSFELVYLCDFEGNFIDANDTALKSFGFTKEDLPSLNFSSFLDEDQLSIAFETVEEILKTGFQKDVVEYKLRRKDGDFLYAESTGAIIYHDGKPFAILGIARDITERKQVEDALQQRTYDLGERVKELNCLYGISNLVEKPDISLEEIFQGVVDLIPPSWQYPEITCSRLILEDDKYRSKGFKETVWKQSQEIFVHGNLAGILEVCYLEEKPELDEGPFLKEERHLINAVAERLGSMIERKRAQEAFQKSKDNLDKAQELAHIGNWSRDLNLNRAQWSDEMYRIFGLTPGDPAEPSFETSLSRIHLEDRERVTSLLKEAAEKKQAFEFEYRTVPIEGLERIIRVRGEVEYDATGNPVRLFGTNQDITETRKLQAQVQESQKIEAIATLAAGIAHNFNNALTPIIGNVDLLQLDHREDQNTIESLKDIKASGLHMAELTSQLLAYAEGGKYNPQVQSLSDFVEDTLPLIQHTLDPAVRVETDLPLDVNDVEADSSQMQMVLSAIMANSNEAMEDPGRIRISTRNLDLDQESIKDHPGLKPGPHVCLSIEDDGKGMDEETRNRIFDPFFTTHFMGRGLGMASVYGIVRNHDGAITVDSELGKGTKVRIYLPAIEAEEKPKKVVVSKPEIELSTGDATILVIEDEEDVMMLIQQVLERLGYRVLQAETGKKAIKLAKTFDGQIDLALLNIKLPDMTGDKVYPLIMKARPDLKVIVCSGYTIEGPPQEILDAGAEGFIKKPFHIGTLAEKLKEVLEGK
jgi:PAS domain S-box-containing protein